MNDYKSLFGLTGSPFTREIAPKDVYRHAQIEEWHYYLANGLDAGSVAVLTGPVGVGKSTALRVFLSELDPARNAVQYVGYTASDRALFREIAQGMGLNPAYLKGDLLVQLHSAIEHAWMGKGRRTILVVDDAHLLSDHLLIELRQMLNFQMDSATPLGMVLVGQPPLRARLKEPQHEALFQRAPIRYILAGLSRQETSAFISAHMQAVGGDPFVFTEEAVEFIFQHSKGIPREICNLCLYSLIRAGWKEITTIVPQIVEEVIRAQSGQ